MLDVQAMNRASEIPEWIWPDPFAQDTGSLTFRKLSTAFEVHEPSPRAKPLRHRFPFSSDSDVPILRIDLDPAYPAINISVEDLENGYPTTEASTTINDSSGKHVVSPKGSFTIRANSIQKSGWEAPNEWAHTTRLKQVIREIHSENTSHNVSPRTKTSRIVTKPLVDHMRQASASISTIVKHIPNSITRPKLSRATSPWALDNAFKAIPNPTEFVTSLHALNLPSTAAVMSDASSVTFLELRILEELSWRMNRGLKHTKFQEEITQRYFALAAAKRLILRGRIKERLLQKGWSTRIVEQGEEHGERSLDIKLFVVDL